MRRRESDPPRRRATRSDQTRDLTLALASLAHEVRTPLNGILAFSEMLADAKLDARAHSWAQAVHSAAQHLARLTTTIVDGARAEHRGLILRHDEFSPRRLAHDIAAALRARAQAAGVPAAIHIARDLPETAEGDAVRLRAALENLVDNAMKFAMGRGVGFSAAWSAKSAGQMQLAFEVSDNGPGLSKSACARLFRPFGQADAKFARCYGGAGLGLFFARNVARAMGGDLTVKSARGNGSTFKLRVRVAAKPAIAKATADEQTSSGSAAGAKSLRILCAEDNEHGRTVLSTILCALGHKATFVADGESAAARARSKPADVILLDVTMAGLDGFATARRIRAFPGAAGRVPIIGVSGHASDERTRAAGMNAYLVKPVTPRALAAAIEAVTRSSAGATRGGKTRRSPAIRSRQ
ncbi:MAG: ATP-binding protein [Variibacter sp.]